VPVALHHSTANMSNRVRACVTLAMICHGSSRCDERRSLKTGCIVAHTRRATMRQPHYPPVSGLCRRWLPTTRLQQGDLRPGEMGLRVSLHGSNPEPLMSALGHKQTSAHVRMTSALPPKADIRERVLDVRFGPTSDQVHRNKKALIRSPHWRSQERRRVFRPQALLLSSD
jgi:hypothetical protein